MSESIFPSMTDLGYTLDPTRYAQAAQQSSQKEIWSESVNKTERDNTNLTFEDMLLLMVTQLQNQTIDNQASTTDMMNQLVQMSTMQAMTALTTKMDEVALANVMSYSASLVDKWVTLGIYDDEGELQEIYGKVEGAGTYDGQQVIFVEGKSYLLSSIMAVGKLPPRVEEKPEDPDKSDKVEQTPDAGSSEDKGGTEDDASKVAATDTDNSVG